jgi:hypothetical protein
VIWRRSVPVLAVVPARRSLSPAPSTVPAPPPTAASCYPPSNEGMPYEPGGVLP